MGSMDSAFGGNLERSFESDDFYESFRAPKFHDFTAPEEPIDPDDFFKAKPEMLRERFVTVEVVKTTAPKNHKVSPLKAHETVTANHQRAPPKSPIAAEQAAVSAVSPKKASRVVSASLSPFTSTSLKNGNSATNSPAQSLLLAKYSNVSLKPTSLAKKLQASENDDPNSPINSSDVAVSKPVKPALTRQRSVKALEVKPTLTRQRNQKVLDTQLVAVAVDVDEARKAAGEANVSKNSSEKESDVGKAPGTSQRKKNFSKPVATARADKAAIAAVTGCKTHVKEPTSNQQEAKPVTCTEVAGLPYSGHHCKSSRFAVNDPNFTSPVLTKKYLFSRCGTPGSSRKAVSNHARGKSNEYALLDDSQKDNEWNKSDTTSVEELQIDASVVKGNTNLVLDEVSQKLALDQSLEGVVEEIAITQVTVTAVTELSKSEVKGLKEVLLGENQSVVVPKQAISPADVRAWAGPSVNFVGKAASSSDKIATYMEKSTNDETSATGIDKFARLTSECLENIDLNQLDILQRKQGKKRKSGELMPAGANKRANCTSDDTRNKVISKKVNEAAASKISNMLRMRRLSVAKRISISRTSSRVTNPRPFRLRTEERGAVKEKKFIKKVEEFKAAKEGFHSAFQGLAVAEPKIPGKFSKFGHVFSAKRRNPKPKDDKEAEFKSMKPGIPPAHKGTQFDHPFKPQRSTKKLTVPREPKFHSVRGSRTCPSHTVPVPAA
ncbi:hypothetical protein KC19_VG022100 [Ceratodon purpureus]|uniref:Uncharacterized protein n=1 Tax=Ceratodon purpureus TaxID=3225 RepID=A0A8T0HL56_CERPU|nr:hypothetical protein KC19_VG022100 [Ceratodon purpureus]